MKSEDIELKIFINDLNKLEGKKKVDFVTNVKTQLAHNNKDEILKLMNQNLEFSKRIKYKEGEVRCLHRIGFHVLIMNKPDKAISYITSALTLAKSIDFKEFITKSIAFLGGIYEQIDIIDKSIQFSLNALDGLSEYSDKNLEADILRNLGEAYRKIKNFKKAIYYHKKSQNIFDSLNNVSHVHIQNIFYVRHI